MLSITKLTTNDLKDIIKHEVNPTSRNSWEGQGYIAIVDIVSWGNSERLVKTKLFKAYIFIEYTTHC